MHVNEFKQTAYDFRSRRVFVIWLLQIFNIFEVFSETLRGSVLDYTFLLKSSKFQRKRPSTELFPPHSYPLEVPSKVENVK